MVLLSPPLTTGERANARSIQHTLATFWLFMLGIIAQEHLLHKNTVPDFITAWFHARTNTSSLSVFTLKEHLHAKTSSSPFTQYILVPRFSYDFHPYNAQLARCILKGNAEGRYALSEGHHEIPVEPRQREREVKDERGKTAHDEMKTPMMVFPLRHGYYQIRGTSKKHTQIHTRIRICRLSA